MGEQEAKVLSEEKIVKVSEEVLKQLNARKGALSSANVLFQMAQREFNLYQREQLEVVGLDLKKSYRVDERTGVIKEIKEEPVLNGKA